MVGTKDSLMATETCLNHNYNKQSVSLPPRIIREGKERGNSKTFSFVDEVELEDSPLKLTFVSEDQNVLDTGVTVQVAIGGSINLRIIYTPCLLFNLAIDISSNH